MDYGIPLHWRLVSEATFNDALEYVRNWERIRYNVTVYKETRSDQRRVFAVQTEQRYYLHPDLLDAMGSNALNELVRESQELGIYDE